ncbi:hypothetical protein D3C71_1467970 [compost metagenome]
MMQPEVMAQLLHQLLIAAHAEDQLDFVEFGRQCVDKLFAEHKTPAASHNQYGRHVLQPQLLPQRLPAGPFPEFRVDGDARHGDFALRNAAPRQDRLDP